MTKNKKYIKDYNSFKKLENLRKEEANLIKNSNIEKIKIKEIKKEIKILREKLIEKNLYIAQILAKKYSNKGIEYDDLYQIASLGLILAIDRFNPDKGFEFSSFATPTITGEIKRYFRDKGWVIRVPRRIQELSKRINNAKQELTQKLKRSPNIDEIAKYLDITSEEVIETMEASQVYSPTSIDKNLDNSFEDRELTFSNILGEIDTNYETIENMSFIKNTMEKFSNIERKIVFYRFFEKMTQISIAEKLDISQMTVSRIEKKVIREFRKELGLV